MVDWIHILFQIVEFTFLKVEYSRDLSCKIIRNVDQR